jgi:hypothetical protein
MRDCGARLILTSSAEGDGEAAAKWKDFRFCTLNTLRADTPSRSAGWFA